MKNGVVHVICRRPKALTILTARTAPPNPIHANFVLNPLTRLDFRCGSASHTVTGRDNPVT